MKLGRKDKQEKEKEGEVKQKGPGSCGGFRQQLLKIFAPHAEKSLRDVSLAKK